MSRREHEPLSPEERELASRLARLEAGAAPSPSLDARILAAARAGTATAAAGDGAIRGRPRRRWPVAMGLAASLVVAVGVAWQLRPQPDSHLLDTSHEPVAASASIAGASNDEAAVAGPATGPATKRGDDRDLLPAAEDGSAAQPAAIDAASAPVAAPAPSSVPPKMRADERSARAAAEAGRRAQARQRQAGDAAARRTAAEMREAPRPAAARAPVASDDRGELPAIAIPPTSKARNSAPPPPPPLAPPAPPAALSPPAPPAAVASPAPAQQPPAAASPAPTAQAADAIEFDDLPAAQAAEFDVMADQPLDDRPPASADSPDVRERWLQRIRELRASGQLLEARASLREFVRRHPHAAVPADLRPLLDE